MVMFGEGEGSEAEKMHKAKLMTMHLLRLVGKLKAFQYSGSGSHLSQKARKDGAPGLY